MAGFNQRKSSGMPAAPSNYGTGASGGMAASRGAAGQDARRQAKLRQSSMDAGAVDPSQYGTEEQAMQGARESEMRRAQNMEMQNRMMQGVSSHHLPEMQMPQSAGTLSVGGPSEMQMVRDPTLSDADREGRYKEYAEPLPYKVGNGAKYIAGKVSKALGF